jgi:hypothetical protein
MKNISVKVRNNLAERLTMYNLNLVDFINSLPKEAEINTIGYELLSRGTNMIINFNEMKRTKDKSSYERYISYTQRICAESQFLFLKLLHNGADKKEIGYFTDELSNYNNIFYRKLAA